MIVIHTAETEPDLSVPDTTAENLSTQMGTATGRAVSWHATVDADSVLHELPSQWTASHLRGWNSRTVGIEIGTKRDLWEQLPGDHAALLIENTARVAAWFCKTHHIPAEQVETLDQAQAGRRGLVAPATLDPTRRRGPGEGFPWEYLLARVADLLKADVIIGLGDRGTKVSDVQSRLTELGYGDLVGDIDGIAGSSFDAAVRAYETDRGFSATGLWIPPSDAYKLPGAEKGCQRQQVSIADSVGIGGANRPDDVEAVSDRLDQLGFMRPDRSLSHCIRLFQTAHEGAESLQRVDGRVDPGGESLAWLNAINVPALAADARWDRRSGLSQPRSI